ncbi:hypothetical protein [Paraburkholderia flava]|uniref:hypothetical protein n=1 Tax=Paraburkholderia flava TaxID=2547393 RepID=UPI00105C2A3E|nr:hypothetical protein [Paraburkholderia flava]
MPQEFSEVLNDLIDYFLVGDIRLLKRYKTGNNLPDDLASEFTTTDSGDNAVLQGIVIPLAGIANHPYTIIFNVSGETPELLKPESRLQHRRAGYVLRVEHRSVMLFTWRILQRFTDETLDGLLKRYQEPGRPVIEVENGWYEVEILGGEVPRNGYFEPAFEFVLKKTEGPGDASQVDINYPFTIA